MANFESQNDELLALQTMYEEKDFVVDGMNPPSGRFVAHVRLPQDFFIIAKISQTSSNDSNISDHKVLMEETFQIQHLPPINLFFQFPDSYPQQTCPAFLLSCNWLTLQQLSDLCKQLESLWVTFNDAILYTWIQFLQDEALEFLNVNQSLDITELLKFKIKDNFHTETFDLTDGEKDANSPEISRTHVQMSAVVPSVSGGFGAIDSRAFNELSDGKILIQSLKDYNEYKIDDVFKCSSHDCDVCLLKKVGSEFITFKVCEHSFCKDCVKEYFEQQIKDGNVNSLNCLHGECKTQADGSAVRQLVSPDLFEKYDTLLLSRTLEGMADVAYCPRQTCQCPLLIDTCGRMGTCPACNFVFCPFCKMAYHGVAPCNFKSEERQSIFEKYLQGSSSIKESLEKRYGKRVIKSLVEDTLSETWKSTNSKSCPRCRASIEKTEGCNKMTCFRCGNYFCWLCMKLLPLATPYLHYSDRNSECFSKLFPEDYLDNAFELEPGQFLNGFEII